MIEELTELGHEFGAEESAGDGCEVESEGDEEETAIVGSDKKQKKRTQRTQRDGGSSEVVRHRRVIPCKSLERGLVRKLEREKK